MQLLIFAAVALIGCRGCDPASESDPDSQPDSVADSSDSFPVDPELFGELELEASEVVPTVIRARWLTTEVSESFVAFGLDGQAAVQVAGSSPDGLHHEAQLLGLKASREYTVRAGVAGDSGTAWGPATELTTGGVPAELPSLSVETDDLPAAFEGFVLTVIRGNPSFVVIYDTEGDYVWWHQDTGTGQLGTAFLTPERDGIVWGSFKSEPDSLESSFESVALDGSDHESISVPGAHYVSVLNPDGTLVYVIYQAEEREGETLYGDLLVERAPDGTVTELWTVWDHFEWDQQVASADGNHDTWPHTNYLLYDEVTDDYIVSLRNLSTVVRVDGASGEQRWAFGELYGDFTLEGAGSFPTYQHGQVLLDGGLLMHDNGDSSTSESRAVEYALDEQALTASEVWEYSADPVRFSSVLGDVDRLPNGNTAVTWAVSGQVDIVSPEGELLWQLSSDLGTVFGYGEWLTSLYGE